MAISNGHHRGDNPTDCDGLHLIAKDGPDEPLGVLHVPEGVVDQPVDRVAQVWLPAR